MRAPLLLCTFLASAVVAALQPACTSFYDCIYVPSKGYQVCAELEPVLSVTRAGDPIEIVNELGRPPTGCTCMHEFTQPTWDANPLDPQLDPLYEQMQEDARVACEELALQLGADPLPCDVAMIDKTTAKRGEGKTDKCLFSDGDIDDDPDCPPFGEDGVFFTTGEGGDEADGDSSESDSSDGGPILPDLPKQP